MEQNTACTEYIMKFIPDSLYDGVFDLKGTIAQSWRGSGSCDWNSG